MNDSFYEDMLHETGVRIWSAAVDDRLEAGRVKVGNRGWTFITLTICCTRDRTHELGEAVYYLEPQLQHVGMIGVFGALRWNDLQSKVVADCRKCKVKGQGKDQRVSRKRLESALVDILKSGRHADTMQA